MGGVCVCVCATYLDPSVAQEDLAVSKVEIFVRKEDY